MPLASLVKKTLQCRPLKVCRLNGGIMGKLIHKKRKKTNTKQQTPQALFNEALARYQRFQKKNAKFEQEMIELIARVRAQVDDYELVKLDEVYELTKKLIPFFSKKTLPEYLREGLFDWIDHNMAMLGRGPYHQHFNMAVLGDLLNEHCDQHQQNRQEKLLDKFAKEGVDEETIAELRDLADRARQASSQDELDDIMREVLEDAMQNSDEFDDETPADADFSEDLFDETADFNSDDPFGFDEDIDQLAEVEQHQELDRLFKASSINKLFRRITKTIHPDLESDEAKKAERHQQMCRLIEARDNKDIAYILQVYTDTFGTLPEQFPEQDCVNLTRVLKVMTERLADQRLDVLESIPFGHAYFDLFHRKTRQQEQAAVRKHIESVKGFTKNYRDMRSEITSIASLKPYLQSRMEYMQLHAIELDEDDLF